MKNAQSIGLGLLLSFAVYAALRCLPLFIHSAPSTALKCEAIRDVSHRPLGELDFSGTTETQKSKHYTDHYLRDRNGKIKVGVREEWGSSLIFFGDGGEESNVLENSRLGHGVHLAFFDDERSRQGEHCPGSTEFNGWNPDQAGNKCGQGSGVEVFGGDHELTATITALYQNPGWKRKDCKGSETVCADPQLRVTKSDLRIYQGVRFVKAGVLEIEVLVTNLSGRKIRASLTKRHEFPRIFPSSGHDGTAVLNTLRDANGAILNADKRTPAATSLPSLHARRGWVTFQNSESSRGVGIYWENRNEELLLDSEDSAVENSATSLASAFSFTLPPYNSVRGRYYLLYGGFETVKALATDLDKSLPPFGRIETNQIAEDARTVDVSGWALDNKGIERLELWVDGKKISNVALNESREDICTLYPGYSMCARAMKVGFHTTYTRPTGSSCDRTVELHALDSDGNERVVARKAISPVVD